ncbi:MAG: hypothetical protein FWH37_07440 [Candidatus Bathyarchaeota archaeon]|nr:hypothetical protein [Candidatus Termiticorpusculum sp.]
MTYFYQETDGLRHEMEQRKLSGKAKQFPQFKDNIIKEFADVETILNKDYHPEANLGVAVNGDGVLTDHGVNHVKMVMDRAKMLLGNKTAELSGYELYILLLSIHFHDLGNIYGRSEHEREIDRVICKLDKLLPLDNVEKKFVSDIAMAHGGYNWHSSSPNNFLDKDTLRNLADSEPCNGLHIRAVVLAAILRFADELADDFSRAKNIAIPENNRLYHEYSAALEPLSFKGETISFHYRIQFDLTQKKLKKGNKTIYLYDEILLRLAKCMRELEYCRKYAGGFINITTLNVKIDVMQKDVSFKSLTQETFRLRLLGYPSESIYKLNQFLEPDNAENISSISKFGNGTSLKKQVKGLTIHA